MIAPFAILAFLIALICFTILRVTQVNKSIREQPISEIKTTTANYYTIARLEEAIHNGSSFHNGYPDNGQKCQCNTVCHPERFYIPEWQPRYTYGHGHLQDDEWRDKYGE